MEKYIEIIIDGEEIKAVKGETILEAALRNGIEIPNLCYNKKVSHTAACRLCVVKLEGTARLLPSCTIPVEEGQNITAFDDELERIRRTTLDLALSGHNDDCINCTMDSHCELQDLAFRFGLGKNDRRFPPVWQTVTKTSDFSSPVLDYEASKCIQCKRCIKACYEVQGKGVISLVNRGIHTTVSTGYPQWNMSKCDGCGECVQICPVGAITAKPVYTKRIRSKDIDRTIRTTCPYCGVGCQLDISTIRENRKGIVKNRIVKVEGSQDIPNDGKTCVKGRFGLDFVDREERLTKPLIKKRGKFVEVEWEEAIRFAVRGLSNVLEKQGPGAIAGLSSARCTNEENYIFQKFIRSVIGTNNVDHCARLCHASTVAGLAGTLGSGAMTNSIGELEHADVILVTGSNTTETHPVIATHIKRAVLFNKAKLIVVDPRKIDLVRYATLWIRQRSGTDVAWVNGIMNVIISEGLHAGEFINEKTENYEAMAEVVAQYTPEKVEEITGIKAADIITAAGIYGNAERGSIIYSMGITQHSNGTDNVKSLANLAMLTGNIGKKSTGVNPLRGQNNVQGACDLGALPNVYPGYQKVTLPGVREKFEKAWNKELSAEVGLSVVEMMNAACEGKVKAMYIMGENPMISDPNINHVDAALNSLDFLICQDIFMTETTALADIILPAASFAEKEGNFTNTERRILKINKVADPPGESLPDWCIIQKIAKGMGHSWNYSSWKDILDEINRLTPQYQGITPGRIEKGEKLQWPCPSEDHPGTAYLHKGAFIRGKGLFSAVEHRDPKEMPDAKYPYTLITGRILYHYHTGTMTRKTYVLPQFVKDAYVEMCIEDMKGLGVGDGEMVDVASRRGKITIKVKESEKVGKGSIFIPFHFTEAAANKLTIDVLDPVAKIPELKVCAVSIRKALC